MKTTKKWPYIPDHAYRTLIFGSSGSGKTNVLLNLIKEQDDIDTIYFACKKFKGTQVRIFDQKSVRMLE